MISIVYQIIPIISFMVGFYFGFTIKQEGKPPEIKTPREIIREKKEERKEEKNREILSQYLDNIESYPYNQKDIKE